MMAAFIVKNIESIRLSNIERAVSLRGTGFDIKLTSRTQISPTKLDFYFEKIKTLEVEEKTIQQITDLPEKSKVTLTAKVIRKDQTVNQMLQNGPPMLRTMFVIADSTGAIELTLWGIPEQIVVGTSYIFKNVTVKLFETKKLSTNPDTQIEKTQDLKNVVADMVFKPKQDLIKVAGVGIETVHKCMLCKASLELNESLKSFKCPSCNKRQLRESVETAIKCEVTGKKADGSSIIFMIPNEVLESLTGKIPNDEKEDFLLGCSKGLQVVFGNTNCNVAAKVKKV